MAEPFNVEQFRQQMSGQAPQGQPPMPVQRQPQMMQTHPSPQLYQPVSQMQQTQTQPQPSAVQPMTQPYAPAQYQGQVQQMPPQNWQPQQMQPQTPVYHMPSPPVFAPPPNTTAAIAELEEVPKKSRFNLRRTAKVKAPKVAKAKKGKDDTADSVHTTKTSPSMIFMFGMASGIVCFLVGNMLMSSFLSDKSAKSFRDIERQNARAQQPVLPQTAQNLNSVDTSTTP